MVFLEGQAVAGNEAGLLCLFEALVEKSRPRWNILLEKEINEKHKRLLCTENGAVGHHIAQPSMFLIVQYTLPGAILRR